MTNKRTPFFQAWRSAIPFQSAPLCLPVQKKPFCSYCIDGSGEEHGTECSNRARRPSCSTMVGLFDTDSITSADNSEHIAQIILHGNEFFKCAHFNWRAIVCLRHEISGVCGAHDLGHAESRSKYHWNCRSRLYPGDPRQRSPSPRRYVRKTGKPKCV